MYKIRGCKIILLSSLNIFKYLSIVNIYYLCKIYKQLIHKSVEMPFTSSQIHFCVTCFIHRKIILTYQNKNDMKRLIITNGDYTFIKSIKTICTLLPNLSFLKIINIIQMMFVRKIQKRIY